MRTFAVIATAFTATPCAVLILVTAQYFFGERHDPFDAVGNKETWLMTFPVMISLGGGGMILSLPAALLNMAIVETFAYYRRDAWAVSLVSGAATGLGLHWILFGVLLPPFVDPTPLFAMTMTGAMMGAVYWVIAVKSRRRLRLVAQSSTQSRQRDHRLHTVENCNAIMLSEDS
jgi:hypothetical protein